MMWIRWREVGRVTESALIAAPSRPNRTLLALLAGLCALVAAGPAIAEPVRIVVLGDSLTAGFGLAPSAAFPAKLEAALRAKGHDVLVHNAGVSGDTANAGLVRLDWAVPEGTDAVIVQLGANDALRGLPPATTRAALDQIIQRLQKKGVAILLAGMRAPPNLGSDYASRFEAIYPELARKHQVDLYPFFLDGVAAERNLNLADGIHPNAAGVDVIVRNILPSVERLMQRVKARERS